jgi:hypothetical protein
VRHLTFDPATRADRLRWKICYQALTYGPLTLKKEELRSYGELVEQFQRAGERDLSQEIPATKIDEITPLYVLGEDAATIRAEETQYELLKRAIDVCIPLYTKQWAIAVADAIDWLGSIPAAHLGDVLADGPQPKRGRKTR